MEFSRQEYWSGLHFLLQLFGVLLNVLPGSYTSLHTHQCYMRITAFPHPSQHLFIKKKNYGDFPSGPWVKMLCSKCRGFGFHPWSVNWIPQTTTKILCALRGMRLYLIMVLICSSLATSDVEDLLICLLAISATSLEKCLFHVFCSFL